MEKNQQRKTEERMKLYYKDQRRIRAMEYELKILLENKEKLEELIHECERTGNDEDTKILILTRARAQENIKKVIKKKIKISRIIERNASISYILSKISDEDRRILELRYYNDINLDKIAENLFMSKSTASRRCTAVIEKLAEDII